MRAADLPTTIFRRCRRFAKRRRGKVRHCLSQGAAPAKRRSPPSAGTPQSTASRVTPLERAASAAANAASAAARKSSAKSRSRTIRATCKRRRANGAIRICTVKRARMVPPVRDVPPIHGVISAGNHRFGGDEPSKVPHELGVEPKRDGIDQDVAPLRRIGRGGAIARLILFEPPHESVAASPELSALGRQPFKRAPQHHADKGEHHRDDP